MLMFAISKPLVFGEFPPPPPPPPPLSAGYIRADIIIMVDRA